MFDGSRVTLILLLAFLNSPRAFCQELPRVRPEAVDVSSKKLEALGSFMQSLVADGKIAGGVTMMARHGKVIHLNAVGMADRDARQAMREDTIFRIASMTKPVTSIAVMMLYDEGKIDLDDPIAKHLPEFQRQRVLVAVEPLQTEKAKSPVTILTRSRRMPRPEVDPNVWTAIGVD